MVLKDAICIFCVIIFWIFESESCSGEVYSALCKLRDLPAKERELIWTFDRFLKNKDETPAITDLKQFVDRMRQENARSSESKSFVENPINGFQLLHRIVCLWGEKLQQYLQYPSSDVKSLPYFMNSVLKNSQNMSTWPTHVDLNGASLALIRIRNVYRLSLEDLHFLHPGSRNGSRLSGSDMLKIGLVASSLDHLYDARLWLADSIRYLVQENSTNRIVIRAYRALGNVFLRLNAPHTALDTLDKALHLESHNTGVKRDIAVFNDVISDYVSHLRPFLTDTELNNKYYRHVDTTNNYAELCRGELKSSIELSELYCTYKATIIPVLLAKVEYVHLNPVIMVYHDVINDQEIQVLKQISTSLMSRSNVTEGKDDDYRITENRISNSAWVYDNDPIVYKLSKRIETLTGLSTLGKPYDTYAEPFQIVNYGIGGMYEPHFDSLSRNGQPITDVAQYRNSGERIATWMFYLSDVYYGGATVFPKVKARIPVKKGSAAFWYNTLRNGLPDVRTLHAGCPVVVGDKWVTNKWMRSIGQVFRRPCALDKNL